MKSEGLAAWRRGGGGEPGGSLGSKVCRPAASPPLGSSAGAGMPGGGGADSGVGRRKRGLRHLPREHSGPREFPSALSATSSSSSRPPGPEEARLSSCHGDG